MGCYMATFAHDYFRLRIHDVEDMPYVSPLHLGTAFSFRWSHLLTCPFSMYEGTGNGQPLLAARLSWFFDLKGPSFVLDTACSSTMVALHLACQSLRTGESTSVSPVIGFNIPHFC